MEVTKPKQRDNFIGGCFDHHTIGQVAEHLKVLMDDFGSGLTRETSKRSEGKGGRGREDGYPMNN